MNYLFGKSFLPIIHSFFFIFVCCVAPILQASEKSFSTSEIKKVIIENAKLASLTVDVEISASVYFSFSGKSAGFGFVVDKKNGIVCTNCHIVGGPCLPESYFVTFHDGKKVEAKPLYYDLWQDIGFLKIDPKEIPSGVPQLTFAKKGSTKEGDRVFSISNTERAAFSFNTGYLSSLYSAAGFMPQHSYVFNYNQVGGSSGAAIFNDHGQIVALNFGGSQSYRLGVDARYVQYLLKFLSQGQVPVRKHIGAILNFYSISDAERYRGFPKDVSNLYMKENPLARGNVIEVESLIYDSPASKALCAGDIVWKIDGVPVVADLCAFDQKLNDKKSVNLNIYRPGKGFIDVVVDTYDVNQHKVNKVVDFCNARFVAADCFLARYKGVKLGTIFCASAESSSPFLLYGLGQPNDCAFSVLEINSEKILSLDHLTEVAERMKKQESVGFVLKAGSHLAYWVFGSAVIANEVFLKDIKLKNDFKLEVHEFDNTKLRWVKTVK